MTGIALSGVALVSTAGAVARARTREDKPASPPPATPSAFAGTHAIAPLPFNPAKLKGLSEKLLRSHHENNYGGAVKNLNKVEEELARTTKDTPGFLLGGLKERELTFTNSMILHEAYFGNLGGDGKASGPIQKLLAGAYGDFGRWEEHFRATGASLAGGSGWIILDYNLASGEPRTSWSGNHTQAVASGVPLLVMDMYEHAYALDYGAAAAKYIDAFFQNIQWDEVNRRLERAQKAHAALKG
ncbi:superoxide dismutase [Vitiosangium sp. GDMCC 1.1324]|nr:superoxide dismutase [Vitiosangium sp. GDMCC 1.1324]